MYEINIFIKKIKKILPSILPNSFMVITYRVRDLNERRTERGLKEKGIESQLKRDQFLNRQVAINGFNEIGG